MHIRYAVKTGKNSYLSGRRFEYKRGSHTADVPFEIARLFTRKGDAGDNKGDVVEVVIMTKAEYDVLNELAGRYKDLCD